MAKRGRPAHEPTVATRAKVEALAAYRIPVEDIAALIEVSPPTLRKFYDKELRTAHVQADAKATEWLFRAVTFQIGPPLKDKDGNIVRDADGTIVRDVDYRACVTANIFYHRTQRRWSVPVDVNLNNNDADDARAKLTRGLDRLASSQAAREASEDADATAD